MKKTLDEIFSDELKQRLTKSTILSSLIIQSIESSCDISLTDENTEYVYQQVLKAVEDEEATGKFTVDLQIDSEIDCEPEIPEFTEDDFENFINNETRILYQESVDWLADNWLKVIRQDKEWLVSEDTKTHEDFCYFLKELWSEPLDSLYLLIQISLHFGSMFVKEYALKNSDNNDAVFEVLTRLHARACQIGYEIHALLSNGFADGASARWRTLFEVCVVAHFIKENGHGVAERYIFHQYIDKYKELKRFDRDADKTLWLPSDVKDLAEALKNYGEIKNTLVEKYGASFAGDYGWAASVIKGANFWKIREHCNLKQFGPNYKIASNFVHGGAIASYKSLGLEHPEHDILVAGPSIFGLSTPGRNVAQSLGHITSLLLGYNLTISNRAYLQVIKALRDDVYKAFDKCELRIDEMRQENDIDEGNTSDSEN